MPLANLDNPRDLYTGNRRAKLHGILILTQLVSCGTLDAAAL
jgi:hypothetical protein